MLFGADAPGWPVVLTDVPVVLGITLVVVIAYVVANLFVDLSYGWFDPRIRTARSEKR